MQRVISPWCLSFWLFTVPVFAQPPLSPTAEPRFKVSIENATVDDALLQAAKAADFSFIADVTDLKEEPQFSVFGSRSAKGMVQDISHQYGLALKPLDGAPFLLWKKPSLSEITALILQGKEIQPYIANPATAEETIALKTKLLDYLETLKAEKLAKGMPAVLPDSIAVRDLPLGLRSSLLAVIERQLFDKNGELWKDYSVKWLTDDFWKTVQLQTETHTYSDEVTTYSNLLLNVSGQTERGIQSRILGVIERRREQTRNQP